MVVHGLCLRHSPLPFLCHLRTQIETCTQHSRQHTRTYVWRQNNIRLLVDKWLNLPDRPVSEGGSRDGREGMWEGSRHDRVKDGGKERGGECDKERQRGREKESQWHMRERESWLADSSWREWSTQLTHQFISPQSGRTDGGRVGRRVKERDMWKQTDVE